MDNPNSLMATRKELAALRQEFDDFRRNVSTDFLQIVQRINQRLEALEKATYGRIK